MLTCTEKGLWPDELDGKIDEFELDRLVEHATVCDYHRTLMDREEEAFLNDLRVTESLTPVYARDSEAAQVVDRVLDIRRAESVPPAAELSLKRYNLYQRWQAARCPLEVLQVRWGTHSVAIIELGRGGGSWHLRLEREAAALQFWTFCRIHGDQVLLATYPLSGCSNRGISELSFSNGQTLRVSVTMPDVDGYLNLILSCTPPCTSTCHTLWEAYPGYFRLRSRTPLPYDCLSPAEAIENSAGLGDTFFGMRLANLASSFSIFTEKPITAAPFKSEAQEGSRLLEESPSAAPLVRFEGVVLARDGLKITSAHSLYRQFSQRYEVTTLRHHASWRERRTAHRRSLWPDLLATELGIELPRLVTEVFIISSDPSGEPALDNYPASASSYSLRVSSLKDIEADVIRLLQSDDRWRLANRGLGHQCKFAFSRRDLSTHCQGPPPGLPFDHYYSGYSKACLISSYYGHEEGINPQRDPWHDLLESVGVVFLISGLVFFEEICGARQSGHNWWSRSLLNRRTWWQRIKSLIAPPPESLKPEYAPSFTSHPIDATGYEGARYLAKQLLADFAMSAGRYEARQVDNPLRLSNHALVQGMSLYHGHESDEQHYVH